MRHSLAGLPAGIDDTMCFMGVGDHGGGPSDELIKWCRAHRKAIPGVTLKFSSPARFFRAIAPRIRRLPLHTGEIQQHAIGCYSVLRPIKLGVRRAENFLAQARRALAAATPAERQAAAPKMEEAWKQVCFTHFHDTFGGSCTATANRSSEDRVAAACFAAERILSETFRRGAHALPPDSRQRFAIANYSGVPFAGWIEHEPWLEWTKWQPDWCLLDERGRIVPHQLVEAEPVMPDFPRLLFPLAIAPGATRVVRLARRPAGRVGSQPNHKPQKPADFKSSPSSNSSSTSPTPGRTRCPGPTARTCSAPTPTPAPSPPARSGKNRSRSKPGPSAGRGGSQGASAAARSAPTGGATAARTFGSSACTSAGASITASCA